MTLLTFWKHIRWHISKHLDGGGGAWDDSGVGGPVISYRRGWSTLLCPVMSVQRTRDWMVYVFNVAGIGSITVDYKDCHTQSRAACVYFEVCVCTINDWMKYS